MSSKFIFAYVTAPDESTARQIGKTLVNEEIVACANILPKMKSIYRWQGKVEAATETVLILKGTRKALPRLKSRLKELHPYENPCLVVLPINDGLPAYLKWLGA